MGTLFLLLTWLLLRKDSSQERLDPFWLPSGSKLCIRVSIPNFRLHGILYQIGQFQLGELILRC